MLLGKIPDTASLRFTKLKEATTQDLSDTFEIT